MTTYPADSQDMTSLAFENKEFLHGNEAGPVRILTEYLHPKAEFQNQGITDTVVMFGSARIPSPESSQNHLYSKFYKEAQEFAKLMTEWGKNLDSEFPDRKLFICTGGGPGIMEAGNRGAIEAGGESVALNISIPHEQHVNPYASERLSFHFHYFFMRKLWFMKNCRAMIAFPGGFGTFDELFETLTLVQTGKKKPIPILLYGSEFWREVVNFPKLAEYGLISPEDLRTFHFVDSPKGAFLHLQEKIRIELTKKHDLKT